MLAYVGTRVGGDDTALIDDGPARAVGVKHLGPSRVHGSLWVLAQGIAEDPRRRASVSSFCNAVIHDGIRWPFGPGGFDRWATAAGLL